MDQELLEWLLLLGRWVHIVTAITWIGTSIFFMWLDRTLQNGELWMVHGGGFYRVQKLLMGSVAVPEHLHWFKWESYWTWISGMFLLLLIFYTGGGTFLLDSSHSSITFTQALLLGTGSIVLSWLFYDTLWESQVARSQPLIGHGITLLWFAGACYVLCATLSGRAAYIHVGAILGTWMTANVFMRIIPRQVKMVEAVQRGEPVNQNWAENAKARSTHNTYFTLPVILIMLSNHFPMTYGHRFNWLILLILSAGGAAIRQAFMLRVQAPDRAKIFAAMGVGLIAGVIAFSRTPPAITAPSSVVPQATSHAQRPSGTLTGVVEFRGIVPKGAALSVPLDCRRRHPDGLFSNEIIVENGKLKNVVVHITKGLEGQTFDPVPTEPVVLDQVDCMYEPRVIAARVGQPVEVVNSDPLFHNVRTVTLNNDNFNVGMPRIHDRITKVFTKPEIVLQTKCDVHPWMSGYIAVIEHPFFAVTQADGRFSVPRVPAGKYTLELWHETLGRQTREIEIKEGETLDLQFAFEKKGDP